MDKARISWQILEELSESDYEYIQYKNYTEEGSFIPGDIVKKTILVWNNYLGTEDRENIYNSKLVFSFKDYEDNFLLNLIRVSIDDGAEQSLSIDMDKGIVLLGDLSGSANNGAVSNTSNFKKINLSIGPIPNNIKSDLKNLYMYVESSDFTEIY